MTNRNKSRKARVPGTPAGKPALGRIDLDGGATDDQIQDMFQVAVEAASPRVQQLLELHEQLMDEMNAQLAKAFDEHQQSEQFVGNVMLAIAEHHVGEGSPVESYAVDCHQSSASLVRVERLVDPDEKFVTVRSTRMTPEEWDEFYKVGSDG
mgnify:CR=1 FL=1|jgi:small basic protein|tara:strand:+ start:4957 stop:5412 length:456 start_codon:yes stop_codon:yes gene_type:complete